MTDAEKVSEWVRYYKASLLKFNALRAVDENDPKLLEQVLKALALQTAADVVKACADDWPSTKNL